MLKRLYLLVTGAWAFCCLVGVLTGQEALDAKVLVGAFSPMLAGWLIARAARWVITGSAFRSRCPVVFRR